MTFAPVFRPLLAIALLSSGQVHAQLDDLFRSPGSPAPVPVERQPATLKAPVDPTVRNAPALPETTARTPNTAADTPIGRRTCHRQQPGSHHRKPRGDLHHPTCPHCHRALKHMQARNIPYLQKDVQHNAENRAEFKRIGGCSVPHILFGDQVVVGFSPQGFDQRHKSWKAGASAAR